MDRTGTRNPQASRPQIAPFLATKAWQRAAGCARAAALLVSAFAPTAHAAQDSVADGEAPAKEPEAAIVVTGSRIATDSTTSLASPVSLVTAKV